MTDETARAPEAESGAPDLASAVSRLMAHPEIIEMAASVLKGDAGPGTVSTVTAPKSDGGDEASEASADALGGDPSALLELLGPMLGGKGGAKQSRDGGIARCTALLIALKPYLSDARCRTVDRIVETCKLGELFERLG